MNTGRIKMATNGVWEWIRNNIPIIASLIALGIWLGTLTAEVRYNTYSVNTIETKLARILCILGETSNCNGPQRRQQ